MRIILQCTSTQNTATTYGTLASSAMQTRQHLFLCLHQTMTQAVELNVISDNEDEIRVNSVLREKFAKKFHIKRIS